MDSFHIIATSTASSTEFPDNTHTSFRSMLPQAIRNAADYEVALQSISISDQFGNLPADVYNVKEHILVFIDSDRYRNGNDTDFGDTEETRLIWLKTARPSATITLPQLRYTAGGLSSYLFAECLRQFEGGDATEVDFHMQWKAMPEHRMDRLAIILSLGALLLKESLARFLMPTHKHVNQFQYVTRGGEKFVVIDALQDSKLILFDRVLAPAQKIYPRLIKVKLAEMKQHVRCSSRPLDLSTLVVDYINRTDCGEASKGSLLHILRQPLDYYPLDLSRLEHLSFKLLDEDDRLIRIGGGGHPTFIKLHIRQRQQCEDDSNKDDMLLQLSSRQSADTYPSNQANSFKIRLTDALLPVTNSLGDPSSSATDWKVALTSIIIPSRIDYDSIIANVGTFWIEVVWPPHITSRVNFDMPADMTCAAFVEHANKVLQIVADQKAWGDKKTPPFQFTERTHGELYADFKETAKIYFGGVLLFLLGRTNTMRTHPVILNGRKGAKLHLGQLDFNRLCINLVFVHCDFVGVTALGNSWSNVLQMIHLEHSPPSSVRSGTYEFRPPYPEFLPIAQTDRNLLQFELKDEEGKPIPFVDAKAEVILTLKFQHQPSSNQFCC